MCIRDRFGYGSTLLDSADRVTYMAGGFVGAFQIPNVAGQAPLGDFGPANLSSTQLNENETDQFYFGLLALQTHHEGIDGQFSAFTRYASTDFKPDLLGDLAFNDVASRVTRKSLLGGLQFDGAARLADTHLLRGGLILSVEQTRVDDLSTLLPLDAEGNPLPTPASINDATTKVGWTAGAYLQDEWTIFPALTLSLIHI